MHSAEKIVSHIRDNSLAFALVKIFEDMPLELSNLLDEAHLRYMQLIGITNDSFDEEVINKDRVKYAEIYKRSQEGKLPIFDDNDCVYFMSEVYGLPKLLCKMQIINDFNWTAASGFTQDANEDIQSACNELACLIKIDELLQETVTFLIEREMLAGQSWLPKL